MKKAIVKAVVLCTLALSLLFVGASAVTTADSVAGEAVCHDGPHDVGVLK
ncbi:MAG: hypothetical protein IJA07_08110 [Agathobacter sp.]|nr:hypothetical protein [Agathobacter sp.]